LLKPACKLFVGLTVQDFTKYVQSNCKIWNEQQKMLQKLNIYWSFLVV